MRLRNGCICLIALWCVKLSTKVLWIRWWLFFLSEWNQWSSIVQSPFHSENVTDMHYISIFPVHPSLRHEHATQLTTWQMFQRIYNIFLVLVGAIFIRKVHTLNRLICVMHERGSILAGLRTYWCLNFKKLTSIIFVRLWIAGARCFCDYTNNTCTYVTYVCMRLPQFYQNS